MDIEKTCCFSGHRLISREERGRIQTRLDTLLDRMIDQGVTTFISGAAWGFDAMASFAVIRKKERGDPVSLLLALPFPGHDARWRQADKEELQRLMEAADGWRYVSGNFSGECYFTRNKWMVDRSAYCICYCKREQSGAGQTWRYAARQKKRIISI